MLLKRIPRVEPATGRGRFSTLYRVDAIEAWYPFSPPHVALCFSTLYRVDAIEASQSFQMP